MDEADRSRVQPCGCRYDLPSGILTFQCAAHEDARAGQARRRKKLKPFRVYFSTVVACATIRAADRREARTIAQDHLDRGELTTENMGDGARLLPEGREISAEFCRPGETTPFITDIEEVP